MKKKLLLLIIMLCFSASGCSGRSKPPEPPKCRVVTEITIQVENAPEPGLCRYTDPRKMTKALNYLRHLDPWDIPETEPGISEGPEYRITLRLSDGSEKVYEQIGLSYFREPGTDWREIPPADAIRLPLLLAAVQSDAI